MKLFGISALLLGLLAGMLLIDSVGFGAVGQALLAVGWTGFFAVAAFHLGTVVLCGIAWFVVAPPAERPRCRVFVWGRLVREAVSEILPLSQLGGFVVGGRAASLAGLSGRLAAASSVVDATVELLAQIVFAALALAIVAALRPEAPFIGPVALALAAALLVAILFVAAQSRGVAMLERIADRFIRQWSRSASWAPGAIQDTVHRIYGQRGRLLSGFLLHLLGWVASAVEAWLALLFMGDPLGLAAVIAIEGLVYAARAMAFAVPAALGVQEGAYVVLGGLFGLTPDAALALSLLKRARGLLLGVPPVVIWQLAEGRRLWHRGRPAAVRVRVERR